ncbi:thiamine diphosphokinase [Rhizobium sp. SSA_523]|uniref:thiamine diphosphokinase n=1 Tax=Rhizobium sp. SSA_523 TaxID=2952477 RepID=UPI002090CE86|nr:thiamine diphosphokinase [Rhizobium sp. SSA_523]MCO5733488.1 thiamine diphosphokinase [Rhizobium sp. SSA_523]WKC23207.1 thiamine diphosphokinase [Rhizobium sp. SSA_523]
MTSSSFTILLGGNLVLTDRLRALTKGTRSIAADSGMRHAAALHLLPELWVGDFDSSDAALSARYPNVERRTYPATKAATDGEIAVAEAIAKDASRLVLAGALGGERSDHALQHYLNALGLVEDGFEAVLTSGEEEAYPFVADSQLELELPKGALFSVLGFTALEGLTIRNARYPLNDFSLTFGSSRTLSNIAEGPISVSLKRGRAILLARPYDHSGA